MTERMVLRPAVAWGEVDAKLVGDLVTILERTGNGDMRRYADPDLPKLSFCI
ncbi:MAG: hypothetical protein J4F47_11390 [Alphaproteobacteria bacterium]|nr:hypothetical protein [Alphaproteobacteria bacterium]